MSFVFYVFNFLCDAPLGPHGLNFLVASSTFQGFVRLHQHGQFVGTHGAPEM